VDSWPFLDLGVLTSSAASGISQVLTVVLFAYLVELGALIRRSPTFADARNAVAKRKSKAGRFGIWTLMVVGRVSDVLAVLWVIVSFGAAQLPLFAVMNGAHLTPSWSLVTWVASGISFASLIGSIGLAFFTTRGERE
jgi:hypothetical protein